MKAPAATVLPVAPPDKIAQIDITDLRIAPWNARKTFDAHSLDELITSIRQHGLQSPLIVRPFKKQFYVSPGLVPAGIVRYVACRNVVDRENLVETHSSGTPEENQAAAQAAADKRNGPGNFEIVAGHRRHRALLKLDAIAVSCIVRELTDNEARTRGLVDNLLRDDVPPMEEAEAYDELKQRFGAPAAIAAQVGKDVAYVTRRLQLVSLGAMPRKALGERLITVDHALLLARLGEDEQNVNLKWVINPNSGVKEKVETTIEQRIKERDREGSQWRGYWEPQSILDLKHHIEQHVGRKLSRAPWELGDAALVPDAGACDGCPSNTKANTALFSDLAIDDATCENGACFEAKRAAFVSIQIAGKKDSDQVDVVKLSWKNSTAAPRMAKDGSGPNTAHVLRDGQWIAAKKGSCPHVRTGVSVDWLDDAYGGKKKRKPGEAVQVCVASGCKVHPKAYEKAKQTGNGERDPAAQKAAAEKYEAAIAEENKKRMAFAVDAIASVSALPAEVVRVLAINAAPHHGEDGKASESLLPGFLKTLNVGKVNSVEFAKAAALASLEQLVVWHQPTDYRQKFIDSIRRLGFKGATPWDKPKAAPAAKKTAAKTPTKKTPAKKAAKKAGRK